MPHQYFTSEILCGNKLALAETLGKVHSVINVSRYVHRTYWQDMDRLPRRTWYFRLTVPYQPGLNEQFVHGLVNVAETIKEGDKLPVLCHCRSGRNRGPTMALLMAWVLDGKQRARHWIDYAIHTYPDFLERPQKRKYRAIVLRWMLKHE